MKTYYYKNLSDQKLKSLLRRPSINLSKTIDIVKPIVDDIKRKGDAVLLQYAKRYDNFSGKTLLVDEKEIQKSERFLSPAIKRAIDIAASNIQKFHKKQIPGKYAVQTINGVKCSRKSIPIQNVGLYIPGGSAVLVSTMLMLGIPAKIAGCNRIVVCSPAKNGKIEQSLLYAAKKCGVKEFYKVGGAHAIASLAYGTKKIKKVDKIFGPGNQFVTVAKALVSTDLNGCAIDMLAGPSEVLVIADEYANPAFVAADLLSQAEHGADSQVILISTSENFITSVENEIKIQLKTLTRKSIAELSLKNSFSLVVKSLNDAIQFSNEYAPEHLIMNFKNAGKYIDGIINAGSVFIGQYSPESAGDYASGTNHSLPTYGYAKSAGGVTVESFMKTMTLQKLSKQGLKKLSGAIIKLAELEKLDAHASAIKVRMTK
ncbi:MAG: histidinol dehydrogenase [Bacteroidota bacterium]